MTQKNKAANAHDFAAKVRSKEIPTSDVEVIAAKVDELGYEISRLKRVIERDRSKMADILNQSKRAINRRSWLCDGRGSFAYDDEDYQKEFGFALTEIEEALDVLGTFARDWFDCPTDPEEIKLAREGL